MGEFDEHYVWAKELRRHRLLFPDDRVVALTRRRYPDVDPSGSAAALDVGFGSGRHIQMLMDLGFTTSGTELIEEAVNAASRDFADNPLLGRLVRTDLGTAPFDQSAFDLVVAWGSAFLRPMDEMARDLALIVGLLRPGGSLVVNFRRPESWFSTCGERTSQGTVLLDDRAGSRAGGVYTFLSTDEAAQLLRSVGLMIADQEELDLVKGPHGHRHSWSLFRAEKPA